MASNPTHPRGAVFNIKHNHRLIFTALSIGICTLTFGYDALVVGNVLAMPAFIAQFSRRPGRSTLTANDISIISSIPVSGGFIGALIVSYVGDKYGRKKTIHLGCLINLISAALQTAATSIAVLTVGRFLASLSAFILLATSVAFQNEVAPPAIRGVLGSLGIVAVNLDGVISSGSSFATWKLSSTAAFRVPLGLQMLFPLIISVGIFFTTDSPTSFLIKGKDSKAEENLRRIRQGYSEHEISGELASLKLQQSLREAEKEVPWTELFKGVNLRRTLLAAYIGNIQVLAGLFYSTNYATIFLAQTGSSDPFLRVFGLSILALGGAIAGLFVVDRIGRRTLALGSIAIISVIDLVIGVMGCLDLTNPQIAKTLVAFFLLFGFFFAAGFGPLVYINPAELPTARLRNKTSAFTFFVQSCNSIVCLYVFPYITNPDEGNLGAKVYLIFAGSMLVCFIITYFVFPELKGRTAAEVDEMFETRLSARRFVGHICTVSPVNIERELVKQEHICTETINLSKP